MIDIILGTSNLIGILQMTPLVFMWPILAICAVPLAALTGILIGTLLVLLVALFNKVRHASLSVRFGAMWAALSLLWFLVLLYLFQAVTAYP